MLKYLSKFVLDSLPSVVATIIGAYIVNHYIIPAAPKNQAATVTPAPAMKTEASTGEKETFAKGVAEKTAIEKTAEKSAEKSADPTASDSRKRHVSPRTANRTTTDPAPTGTGAPATDERRDANDLARAAIERLRAGEPPRTVAVAPSPPMPAALHPLTTATAPSLGPDVFNAGTSAIGTSGRQPQTTGAVRSADASKPMPPANIPGPPPLELHDDIVVPNRVTSVADDVVSAAKSMIHAVLPR